jgi:hypothetical protein
MLTTLKKQKLLAALKAYRKKFLDGQIVELDESGTRLLLNSFLSDVLGYKPIEEIRTEYMIKGTYADYVVQIEKIRYFLVEVKALSFALSEKHLRQVVNYGANEGIEYALLTNGKNFEFYKILFDKPIDSRRLFTLDLSDQSSYKDAVEFLQHLHRDSVLKNNFKALWNKCEASDPYNISGILVSGPVTKVISKMIRQKYNEKCPDEAIVASVTKIIADKMDAALIRAFKPSKSKTQKPVQAAALANAAKASASVALPTEVPTHVAAPPATTQPGAK